MAMKRPLIMGVRGEAADIVRRSGSGIDMEPDNENDLIDAVLKLKTDRPFYQTLCESGRDFVTQHYTRDVLAADFLQIIQTVADKRPIANENHG